MFQFSGLAPLRVIHLQCTGLSHSEIFGLSLVCSYPKLIAAYHVLLRLPMPRHPPCALVRFKYCFHPCACYSTRVILFALLLTYNGITAVEAKIAFPICQRTSDLYKTLRGVRGFEPLLPPLRLHLFIFLFTARALRHQLLWRISESNR